jgi:hypothetical protein
METLRVTYTPNTNQQPLAPYWSRESFIVPIAQLKRRGQWHRGDAVKFVGQFRPLNRLLKEDSPVMWLGDEDYKISVKLAEFETIAFDVWHCKQHQLRQVALLEWLMERAKEKREKKTRKRRDSHEKWNKITITGDHNRVGRLVRDFAHVDTKGIRFSHSASSSLDHYDFFVRAHLAKTTEVTQQKTKHASFDNYGFCEWCDKWTRGGVCKRKCDSSGGDEDESSYVTIKYRRGDRKFDIFEYENRADKLEFIHKVMYRSTAKVVMAQKKPDDRTRQNTDELINY